MNENNFIVPSPSTENKNGVKLMSAHSSKGLEFKAIFIIHVTDKNWGSTRKPHSLLAPEVYNDFYDFDEEYSSILEDERRLFLLL